VYVELLLPPTLQEHLNAPNQPSFSEKEFGLSQIPHMCFADMGDGVNIYIFFLRATYNKCNSHFKDANVTHLDQQLCLNHITLPALQEHVPYSELAHYGYDADGFNQKTATQTHITGLQRDYQSNHMLSICHGQSVLQASIHHTG
jgi:hypothetical protein